MVINTFSNLTIPDKQKKIGPKLLKALRNGPKVWSVWKKIEVNKSLKKLENDEELPKFEET